MAPPDDRPTRAENVVAYAAATLATLVWAVSVLPGVHLSDPAANVDLAAPMLRGPLLILPALLLLVAGPVTTVIARGVVGLRALLAAGDAFVALFSAAALASIRTTDGARWVFAGVLLVIGAVAVRDTVLAFRVSEREPEPGADGEAAPGDAPPPRWADLRLALALLVLLTPPSLLAVADLERASLMALFGYVAISAFGARSARGAAGLRLTASVLFAALALHLLVTVSFVLRGEGEGPSRWTWCGWATVALSWALLLATLARVAILLRSRSAPPAAPAAAPAP